MATRAELDAVGVAGLDPVRIAEVIVVTAAGRQRGSGYLVAAGTVLTAAHVVAEAQQVTVRCAADRPGEWSAPASVAWLDRENDLAVLSVPTVPTAPAASAAPAAMFGRVSDEKHEVVAAHAGGFPLWKQRTRSGGRRFREIVVADGRIAVLSNLREGMLELVVTPSGEDPDPTLSPWAGMSGAALWVGDRIVGVVAEHHRHEGLGRLSAVRLDAALAKMDGGTRSWLLTLLSLPQGTRLPLVGTAMTSQPEPRVRVVGIPVAYGIELFKNRAKERNEIAARLADPAVRLVTVTGRRGVGKSALAAKMMDQLDRGEWLGPTPGPVPFGLVNLSTRTTGITLQRVYFDCARLLGPAAEERLTERWLAGGSAQEHLAALSSAIDDRLIILLMDNVEDLLDDDGTVVDQEFADILDWLLRAHRATPKLLITSQVPLRLRPEQQRYSATVLIAEGLGPEEAVELLRELDQGGRLGIAGLSDSELLNAAVRVHGIPRALELLVGAVADDDSLVLPTLREVVQSFILRADVVEELAEDRYKRLDLPARTVLQVLAALRTAARYTALEEILAGPAPELPVAAVLRALARVHLVTVDREHGVVSLHPLDAEIAYRGMSESGPLGRQAMERRIADWYAGQTKTAEDWRHPDDLTAHRKQFEHLVRAGDHDDAARVLIAISEWLVWHGSVLTAVAMHLEVDGRIVEERLRLAHLTGYAHARLSAGPIEQAVQLFEQAVTLAEALDERTVLQYALFGLGDAHRQAGRPAAAIGPIARAAELAHEAGDGEREMHALLSLSLTHSYLRDGATALEVADRLALLAAGAGPADSGGGPLARARAGNARTIALLTLQHWDETVDSAVATVRDYRAAGSREAVAYALNAQGIALLALGALERAVPVLEEACQEASLMENPRTEGVCLLNLAWAYWCDGRPQQSADRAERAVAAFGGAGAAEASAAGELAAAARALTDSPADAAAALRRAATALDGNAEIIDAAWLLAAADGLDH
nr:trypsin-like peptidase domain-containing protein [Streptomyces sp. 846.5]